ncbi:MAG: tetratricopeptide repeat protein [bacterium]|nr:tetratricopeptide repeat protein [bacterium]
MSDDPSSDDARIPERAPVDSVDAARALAKVSANLLGAADSEAKFGRFTLLEQVGAGAMGTVYAALDPELDRRIAIKLLKSELDESQPRARARMRREARALAKLNHPNVASVYEVGQVDERAFIAMEFVDGRALDVWMEDRPPWREVVSVFCQAGRGLAAAHDAGSVHRDFKPGNVMLGADGRVVVLDFGLAAPYAATETQETADESLDSPIDRLTATRAVVGTPAYMAPEQHRGEQATTLSDQFAFCVSLFEALHGTRPFKGRTRASVLEAIEEGRIVTESPTGSRVAPRLNRVLRRGLSARPEDRFSSMHALLAELDLRRASRRRVAMVGVLGGSVALAIAYGVGAQHSPVDSPAECIDSELLRAELWDRPYRGQVQEAYAGDARPHVRAMADSVVDDIDGWAQRWSDARASACRATRERGEQSEALLQLRMRCYESAAVRLRVLATALTQSDDDRAGAPALVPTLPNLALCSDTEWLIDNPQLPAGEDGAARLALLEETLAKARLEYFAGRLDPARAMYEGALAEAKALQHEPSEAAALFGLARIDGAKGDRARAEARLTEAMTKWLASGDEFMAADAALELMEYASADRSDPAERRRWAKVAEGLITKIGSPPELEARLQMHLAAALEKEGDPQTALEHAERGLSLYEGISGERHPNVADAYQHVGNLLQQLGRAEEGLPLVEKGLAIEIDLWGEQHPRVAASRDNLGILYGSLGRAEEAAHQFETALASLEEIYGMDSPKLAVALSNLGEARMMQDRPADTLALNERAGRLNERAYGADHPEVAYNLNNGAGALIRLERYAEAETRLRRALSIRQSKLGNEHPLVGEVQFNLGAALSGQSDHQGAVEALSAAERIWKTALGERHPNTAAARVNLGEAQIAAGRRREGLATMRAGVDGLARALGADHPDVAEARAQLRAAEASG